MSMQNLIETQLENLNPVHLDVKNESHMHSGPATDSHYKVVVVSEVFTGKRQVARHQQVYALLNGALQQGLHALAIHTYTPEEWSAVGAAPASPKCGGGSKHDPLSH